MVEYPDNGELSDLAVWHIIGCEDPRWNRFLSVMRVTSGDGDDGLHPKNITPNDCLNRRLESFSPLSKYSRPNVFAFESLEATVIGRAA
ncbi:unnamed protein product [Allacma fusca]|uniref:Uncharacterized protein n=1 Tax=Allacma fusca TaxID=39272 RepID=A0A8J2J6Z2_9HEXA|nr:unnamed protein product [Allacma fusca]